MGVCLKHPKGRKGSVRSSLPSVLGGLLLEFRSAFSAPTFENFVCVAIGWLLCTGRHTITRVIQAGFGAAAGKHHSTFYRFFSRAVWDPDVIGRVLLRLVLRLVPGGPICLTVDDTLCHKGGPHLFGAGMHHDAARSTYGGGAGRQVFFAFGHNWVIVCVWVPLPWNPARGIAIPVRWRLYRGKKHCPPPAYQPRTALARLMLRQVLAELPPDRAVQLLADREYASQTVVRHLPRHVTFIGAMHMDAAFYAPAPRYRGVGRPRVKGARLPSPNQLLADDAVPWERKRVTLYGRRVWVLVKMQVGLWYTVAGGRRGRMLVTRDPNGRWQDRAYFATDPQLSAAQMLAGIVRRWSQEVTHRDLKQHLGFEDPQNGWWRRPATTRRAAKQAGAKPHAWRGAKAARRTTTIAFVAYALVAVWYFEHGASATDVARVRKRAPWYRHKATPSFADMLEAVRRHLWAARLSEHPLLKGLPTKVTKLLPEWLVAA